MSKLRKETQAYKNKLTYIREFNKTKTKRYTFTFNKVNDKEIIEHLDNVPNKNDYIRQLILEDMQKQRG